MPSNLARTFFCWNFLDMIYTLHCSFASQILLVYQRNCFSSGKMFPIKAYNNCAYNLNLCGNNNLSRRENAIFPVLIVDSIRIISLEISQLISWYWSNNITEKKESHYLWKRNMWLFLFFFSNWRWFISLTMYVYANLLFSNWYRYSVLFRVFIVSNA